MASPHPSDDENSLAEESEEREESEESGLVDNQLVVQTDLGEFSAEI
jgi:hypothetical protein